MSAKIEMKTVEEYIEFLIKLDRISDFDKNLDMFKEAVLFYCNNRRGRYEGIEQRINYFMNIDCSTPILDEVLCLLAFSDKNARIIAKMIVESENTAVTPFELFKLKTRLEDIEKVISGIRDSVK